MPNESERILVVDDEAVIRELMTDILREDGYSVESAPNGMEALDILRNNSEFVLLFTDIMMPQMDGIELIREARLLNPSLIPIVMTGYATLESARAAVKEGAYNYVLKPFSLSEVKLAVSSAFERNRLMKETARLQELTELFKISEAIATIHNEKKLLDFVLRAALDRVGAERGSIMLPTEDGKTLEVAASLGLPQDLAHETVEVDKSISGWVARHGLPLRVQDIDQNPDLVEISNRLEDASFVSMPLERKLNREGLADEQRVLAVLNVTRKKGGGYFTEGDQKILSIVANHASVAIENVRLLQAVEDAHRATLESMAKVLEAKDPYTHGHSERVRNYSIMAAQKLGMNDSEVQILALGAMLHDVGKIGVSDAILNKEEKLGGEDWGQIRRHPVIGYEVLAPVGFLTERHLGLVRSHHERLDGSGYPDQLPASDQNDLVRVIAVADTYDAMSGDRAYRKGLTPEKIIEELKRCAGQSFDTKVVNLFVDLIERGEIEKYATRPPQENA